MHIVFGDSRLEPVEVPVSDAKEKEMEHNGQQVLVRRMEEGTKKVDSDAFTLEVSKAGVDAYHVKSDETNRIEPIEGQDSEQQKELIRRQTMGQQISSGRQHALLENINISE